jgi:hypothetical protein
MIFCINWKLIISSKHLNLIKFNENLNWTFNIGLFNIPITYELNKFCEVGRILK